MVRFLGQMGPIEKRGDTQYSQRTTAAAGRDLAALLAAFFRAGNKRRIYSRVPIILSVITNGGELQANLYANASFCLAVPRGR